MADMTASEPDRRKVPVIPSQFLGSFILVTTLFALWGFANDITNPMVAAFKNILLITNFESSLVQFAFYGGYCVMAIPAAIFIKRFSYKAGILMGLFLYVVGCLLFIPSGWMMAFPAFLLAYFIMTCGLSFLETCANPYILSMGPQETATRRLNFAQSFNPIGSLMGMFVAMNLILANLNPMTEDGRRCIQGLSDGTLYHQQAIQAAADLLDGQGVQDHGRAANVAVTQDRIRDACAELIRLSPEWSAKAADALGSLGVAAESDDAALQVARDEIREVFQGQASFLNLLTGELDLAALDKAALIHEEFNLSTDGLKAAIDAARSDALAALEVLQPLADSQASFSADQRHQTAEGAFSSLSRALVHLQEIDPAAISRLTASAQERLTSIQQADLDVIIGPYAVLGGVVFVVLLIFVFYKLPRGEGEDDTQLRLAATLKTLWANKKYIEGVIAQAFYVGVQIMCWTFIIQYAEDALGMAKPVAQKYNIIAMTIFVTSRFICTHLLKYFSPGGLLMSLALGGFALILGVIFIPGMPGLYCLVGVSACMSLMFPTIYGIALKGMGDEAKLASAGLIMAIGGGSVMPPLQAAIMDMDAFTLGSLTLSSTRVSFVLPLLCFVVIAVFGFRTSNIHKHTE